jgi:hypothetical protein
VASVELHASTEAFPEATAVGAAASVAVGAGIDATVAVAGGVTPPGPVHTIEYTLVAMIGPVLWVPLAATVPLHPPDAIHESALVDVHVKVEAPPEATAVGVAVSATIGKAFTVTGAVAAALLPPGPVHVKEKIAFAVNAPVFFVPLLASVPLQSPDAAHEVAWAELQVSVEVLPAATTVGFAASCTVGSVLTVIVMVAGGLVPPGPMQVSE